MSDTPETPAGWYPDPDGGDSLRYWDGTAWTEHRHASGSQPETAVDAPPTQASNSNEDKRSRRRAVIAVLGGLLVVALVIGGLVLLSGGDDDGGSTASTYRHLLGFVPDEANYRSFILLSDYDRAGEAAGLARPRPDEDDEEVIGRWVVALTSRIDAEDGGRLPVAVAAGFGSAGPRAIEVDGWREEFGFSILDVSAGVEAGQLPEAMSAVSIGVDAADIDAAVRSDPLWSDRLTDDSFAGIDYYQWGSDGEIDLQGHGPSAARPVAQGGQLAVVDGTAVRTTQDVAMHAVLGARSGGTSLADDDVVTSMVDTFDEFGVYSLFLTDTPPVADVATALGPNAAADDIEAFEEAFADAPALAPYDWLGAGGALEGDQSLVVIVLANRDETTAEENVDRLTDVIERGESFVNRKPWSEALAIRSIEARGTLTVAVLEVLPENSPAVWIRSIVVQDSLYWMAS